MPTVLRWGLVFPLFCLLNLAAFSASSQPPSLRFEISFPRGLSDHPLDGHVLLLVGLVQHYLPQMIEHMEETAPSGADVKSWKY